MKSSSKGQEGSKLAADDSLDVNIFLFKFFHEARQKAKLNRNVQKF
jgi:hypothetical protein